MDFRTAAIVPVAGLSSRMGSFKPLLEIDGEPLIRRTVRSVLAGGAREVRVVLGREAEAVRAALADLPDITFVENPLFASTDMLRSVQLAMRGWEITSAATPSTTTPSITASSTTTPNAAILDAMKDPTKDPTECLRNHLNGHEPDALFILPGDVPAIAPRTFEILAAHARRALQDTQDTHAAHARRALQDAQDTHAAHAVQDARPQKAHEGTRFGGSTLFRPLYRGEHGHPLLVCREAYPAIIGYAGDGGLKAALAEFALVGIEVPDKGVLLDADTPEDLARLEEYIRSREGDFSEKNSRQLPFCRSVHQEVS
ncbi:MAG: nucleotidyltransferase family protein [Coriobacteriales bacterium]|jgi:CTP:molybdopterin cytidylyltransferase MocA|nr:nucleotidyltransferase family protein [Coriobacteriales bacterium]